MGRYADIMGVVQREVGGRALSDARMASAGDLSERLIGDWTVECTSALNYGGEFNGVACAPLRMRQMVVRPGSGGSGGGGGGGSGGGGGATGLSLDDVLQIKEVWAPDGSGALEYLPPDEFDRRESESVDGGNWWTMKSLSPVLGKKYGGKSLFNFSTSAPSRGRFPDPGADFTFYRRIKDLTDTGLAVDKPYPLEPNLYNFFCVARYWDWQHKEEWSGMWYRRFSALVARLNLVYSDHALRRGSRKYYGSAPAIGRAYPGR